MVGWHQTSRVEIGHNQYARFCAFQAKPFARRRCKCLHKGRLFLPVEERKVVVYTFPASDRGLEECRAELEKQRVCQDVISHFPDTLQHVKLAPVLKATVEVVSSVHRFFPGELPVEKGSPVLIQDQVNGAHLQNFFTPVSSRGRKTPLTACSSQDDTQLQPPGPLLHLAQASLAASGGRCIVIGAKGLILRKTDVTEYLVTSLVVHSVNRTFGGADRGREGMKHFVHVLGLEATVSPMICLGRFDSQDTRSSEQEEDACSEEGGRSLSGKNTSLCLSVTPKHFQHSALQYNPALQRKSCCRGKPESEHSDHKKSQAQMKILSKAGRFGPVSVDNEEHVAWNCNMAAANSTDEELDVPIPSMSKPTKVHRKFYARHSSMDSERLLCGHRGKTPGVNYGYAPIGKGSFTRSLSHELPTSKTCEWVISRRPGICCSTTPCRVFPIPATNWLQLAKEQKPRSTLDERPLDYCTVDDFEHNERITHSALCPNGHEVDYWNCLEVTQTERGADLQKRDVCTSSSHSNPGVDGELECKEPLDQKCCMEPFGDLHLTTSHPQSKVPPFYCFNKSFSPSSDKHILEHHQILEHQQQHTMGEHNTDEDCPCKQLMNDVFEMNCAQNETSHPGRRLIPSAPDLPDDESSDGKSLDQHYPKSEPNGAQRPQNAYRSMEDVKHTNRFDPNSRSVKPGNLDPFLCGFKSEHAYREKTFKGSGKENLLILDNHEDSSTSQEHLIILDNHEDSSTCPTSLVKTKHSPLECDMDKRSKGGFTDKWESNKERQIAKTPRETNSSEHEGKLRSSFSTKGLPRACSSSEGPVGDSPPPYYRVVHSCCDPHEPLSRTGENPPPSYDSIFPT